MFLSVSKGPCGDAPERLGGGLPWDREVGERDMLSLCAPQPALGPGPPELTGHLPAAPPAPARAGHHLLHTLARGQPGVGLSR